MHNTRIADVFDEIADLLEIQEGNQYRIRAYRNAARTVRDLGDPLQERVEADEDLTDLPGIGESMAEKIEEIIETGTARRLEDLKKNIPSHLTDLLQVEGLGPRKVELLHSELGIEDLDGLREAAEEGRIRGLEGMGEKTEQNILDGLATLEAHGGRMGIKAACDQVEELGGLLDEIDAIRRWEVAGSFRRRKETVGDLDVLIEATDRERAGQALVDLEPVESVIGRGEEKISVRTRQGLQVDFRFFEKASFGAAMMYFTGSKAHNIRVRKRAGGKGYKLNEYGLFDGDERVAGKTEESIYHELGLDWVPPELREDRGEVDAAADGKLPKLIEQKHIRGDLHLHTDATDGRSSLEEMADAARERGYDYLAITDHSKAVAVTGGLDTGRLQQHAERIRALDEELDDLWLLAGIEVDILADGRLDLPDEALEELDWVVGSVHSALKQSEKKMTDRLVRAISSGVIHCLGHPTNRLIGKRDPVRFDFGRVLDACRANGVALEINAHPDRLDLSDAMCIEARRAGVDTAIVTDAHQAADLDLMAYGVWNARRGWLRKGDVLNTLAPSTLAKRIGGRRT